MVRVRKQFYDISTQRVSSYFETIERYSTVEEKMNNIIKLCEESGDLTNVVIHIKNTVCVIYEANPEEKDTCCVYTIENLTGVDE